MNPYFLRLLILNLNKGVFSHRDCFGRMDWKIKKGKGEWILKSGGEKICITCLEMLWIGSRTFMNSQAFPYPSKFTPFPQSKQQTKVSYEHSKIHSRLLSVVSRVDKTKLIYLIPIFWYFFAILIRSENNDSLINTVGWVSLYFGMNNSNKRLSALAMITTPTWSSKVGGYSMWCVT